MHTPPWRISQPATDAERMREALLQAGFLRFCHIRQSARPRYGKPAADPSSAVKTLAIVRRMHADRGYAMGPTRLVQVELRRLQM
eukprot:1263930-Pleurochrysis_carterae.AAC.1